MNKQFTLLKAQEEEDGTNDSDEEQLHFQFMNHFSLINQCVSAERTYQNVSMKQSTKTMKDLNLRKVILLDNQSTMSLFCNKKIVSDFHKSNELLTLHSNGGSMQVRHVASINKTNQHSFAPRCQSSLPCDLR